MVRPENCSTEIYNLLESCWTDDPAKRPTFKLLANKFEKLLGRTAKYLEMEEISISNPMYMPDDNGELNETFLRILYSLFSTTRCCEHSRVNNNKSHDRL